MEEIANAPSERAKGSESRRCPQCGEAFECGANAQSCWCNQVPATPAQLARLREIHPDAACICERCLKAYLSDNAATGAAQNAPSDRSA